MKHIQILLFMLLPITAFSQLQYEENGGLCFDEVYQIDLPKDQLNGKINEWVDSHFKNAVYKIQKNSDTEITASGKFEIPYTYNELIKNMEIGFLLKIITKEGAYRLAVYDMKPVNEEENAFINITSDYFSQDQYKKNMLKYIATLGKEIQTQRLASLHDENDFLKQYQEAKEFNETIKTGVMEEVKTIAEQLNLFILKSSKKS